MGIDLNDYCVPATCTVSEWAVDIIDQPDLFTQISPSGTGFHVLVRGEIPGDRDRKGDVDLYETGRFFTVMGGHLEGTHGEFEDRPDELVTDYDEYVHENTTSPEPETDVANFSQGLDDHESLRRAKAAANGDKFEPLWRGSTAGYESHSKADMAVCALLAFWMGGDAQRMDLLFRDSGLLRKE